MKSIIEYKMEIFIYVRDFYRAIMKMSENNLDVPLPLFDINIKKSGVIYDYCKL